jgi:hypothetical protein
MSLPHPEMNTSRFYIISHDVHHDISYWPCLGLHVSDVVCLMPAATLGLALVDLVGGHSDLPE